MSARIKKASAEAQKERQLLPCSEKRSSCVGPSWGLWLRWRRAWAASSPPETAKSWLLLPLGLCRKSAALVAPFVSSYLLALQKYVSFATFFYLGCVCFLALTYTWVPWRSSWHAPSRKWITWRRKNNVDIQSVCDGSEFKLGPKWTSGRDCVASLLWVALNGNEPLGSSTLKASSPRFPWDTIQPPLLYLRV